MSRPCSSLPLAKALRSRPAAQQCKVSSLGEPKLQAEADHAWARAPVNAQALQQGQSRELVPSAIVRTE